MSEDTKVAVDATGEPLGLGAIQEPESTEPAAAPMTWAEEIREASRRSSTRRSA